ncbi:MAG TPA: penicillin-binding protein 2 [Methylomirabilota bacterium]|jgi:penicillin-binding protein 2|nr:penicillin-binding protein 2 [Methylomirabilota bacterium]
MIRSRPAPVAPRLRLRLLATGLGLAFLAVAGQLANLQILSGERMAALSDRNRLRLRPIVAPRGILFDRAGLPLVDNRPAFTLVVVPRDVPDLDALVGRLAELLAVPVSELKERLARVSSDSPWPIRLSRGLTLDEVARIEEWRLDLPGVTVEVEPQRAYPGVRFAAHLLGYVREASDQDLGRNGMRRGDLVGQTGLERLHDGHLRGRDGGEQVEVDAYGRMIRILDRQEPVPGAHMWTTIDRRIQQAAEDALGARAGAIVVMDPRNGDVLALTSHPAYPVERFSRPLDRETWLALVQDPTRPLLNRAVQGIYPPGSLFKIVVAAAALQSQVITPFDRLSCPRQWVFGGRPYHNWEDHDRGALTLHEALQFSCNTYFYQLGLKLGPEKIVQMAGAFGLGRVTESGLTGERSGLVPSPAWKRETLKDKWHPGDTVSLSIGQGLITVTPLQVARMMAAVANGGTLWKPRLVDRVATADGRLLHEEAPEIQGRVEMAPVIFEFLREALGAVVAEGTGKQARVPGVTVGGKTGTAQTHEFRSDADRKRRDQDHAWFAGFAPLDEPQVVVVVFAERAGLGGQVAAPIAREVLKAVFLEKVARADLPR